MPPANFRHTYKGLEIKLFQEKDKWDYQIPEFDSEYYNENKYMYDSKDKALEKAKKEIDNKKTLV